MLYHFCRGCDGQTSLVLDLGRTAPSRRFLSPQMAHQPEPNAPLRLVRCQDCGLIQLDEACPGEPNEWSLTLPADADATARLLVERHGLSRGDQVIEVGDGAYAASFRPLGVRTRVIDSLPMARPEIQSAKIVMARDALCRAELNPFLRGVCAC